MLAPKYIETNPTVLRDQKQRLENHQLKLKEIMRGRRRGDFSVSGEKRTSPPRTFRSTDAERMFDIHLENKVLFEKLVSIREGRASATQMTPYWEPKSLNHTTRQREMERIAEENSQMAKRLVAKPSHLSHKKLDDDYSLVLKYRQQISRAVLQSKRQKFSSTGKASTLPEAV